MSDVVWQALIAAVLAIVLEWMRRKTQSAVTNEAHKVRDVLKVSTDLTAAKVEEVKEDLRKVTDATLQKLNGIEIAVNNKKA